MKHLLLFLFGLLFTGLTWSQVEVRKAVISSGGGSMVSGSLYMVYALGETAVREADAGNIHLSEGFVGPDIYAIMGIEDYALLNGIKVYPSPVKNVLHIIPPQTGTYEISMFDLTGKMLFNKSFENTPEMHINVRKYPSGVYLLAIIDRAHQKAITLKFQKQ